FKIRMDLEMEKGTDALSAAGEAVEPRELDPIELSEEDIATIRATQGPMPVLAEPYAPAAERLGVGQEEVLRRLGSLREGIAQRATLYSSTEFKKVRMLYFTDAFRDWERENA